MAAAVSRSRFDRGINDMILKELADITGDAATHPLSTGQEKSKIVQLYADAANAAPVRVGGSTTSATRGTPLLPGAAMFLPAISDPFEFWQLAKVFYYAAASDKLYVLYATEGSNS